MERHRGVQVKKESERREEESKPTSGSDGISVPFQPKYLDCVCCHLQSNLAACNMHEAKYQAMHTALGRRRPLYWVDQNQEPRDKHHEERAKGLGNFTERLRAQESKPIQQYSFTALCFSSESYQ